MSKVTDAAIAAIVAKFENGDVPDGTDFSTLITAVQEAAQDHEHNAGGGSGAGTGDAGQVVYPAGISGLFLDGALSPMILTGGEIQNGTNAGTLKVTALTALLRASTDEDGVLTVVSKAEEDNIAISAAETTYHVVLQYNSGTPLIVLQAGSANGTTEIGIGKAIRNAANFRWHRCSGMRLSNGVAKLHQRAAKLRDIELRGGSAISDEGSLNFEMTAGDAYEGANHYALDAFASLTDKFTLIYYGDTPTAWQLVADQTAIPNDEYNDYGADPGLVDIASNQYTCFWVYQTPCNGNVYVAYGRSSDKLAAAEAIQPPSTLPLFLAEFGMLVGCIIVQEGGSTFATIQMVTDRFFSGTAVADHGELSGLDDDDHSAYVKRVEIGVLPKTADESVTNSVVLQDDNHLFLSVAAYETVYFVIQALFTCITSPPNVGYGFTFPAGGALYRGDTSRTGGAMTVVVSGVQVGALTCTANKVNQWPLRMFYVGGATAGTVQFQWCQYITSANALTLLKGSQIQIWRNV